MLTIILQNLLWVVAATTIGPNMAFWSLAGLFRKFFGRVLLPQQSHSKYFLSDVAVVIAAHNEENSLPSCLHALCKILPSSQVFVGNDCSLDKTAIIANELGCNVYTAPLNVGKAKILDATIEEFKLYRKFKLILFLDADSEIDPDYFKYALPMMADERIGVIAGHVISRPPKGVGLFGSAIHAYRVRLYGVVQYLFKFGQTWGVFNVTFVAPGFASLYRSRVLVQLDITAPGLVIEDINMTLEVHRKKLGRVGYLPQIRCCTEDPASISDYSKQVKRWNLGLWQAMRRQGLWSSLFCVALLAAQAEVIFFALYIILLPVLVVAALVVGGHYLLWMPNGGEYVLVSPLFPLVLLIACDVVISAIVAVLTRNLSVFAFAPLFFIFRFIDGFWTLATIAMAFFVKSDGRWTSPKRLMR